MTSTADLPHGLAAAEPVSATQRIAFALALAAGSRAIFARDWMLGRIRLPRPQAHVELTSLTVTSGLNRLDALFAVPMSGTVKASVLICHGIGEVVVQWAPIQQMLAAHGIASLVFDYAGYGRSTGWPTPAQLEQDALAAHARLKELASAPISLLGFSLGTGVAVAILHRVETHRVVLCAGFTSFREATHCVGVPRALLRFSPQVWNSESILRSATHPVLVVHSTHDRLFPAAMGESLAGWCGNRAQLRIVQGLRHNEPFYKPTTAYWDPIAAFLASDSTLSTQLP